jgi:hypothetical protein
VQAEISYKPRFKAIPPQEISLSEIFSWDEVTSYYDWLQKQFMDESQGSKLAHGCTNTGQIQNKV